MREYKVRDAHFPVSIFFTTLGAFLLMGGIHAGLVVAINEWEVNSFVATIVIMLYWIIVATGYSYFIWKQIRVSYEEPMKEMAKAADAVAHGDFSVYLSPIHTAQRLDYLDIMIMDFNKMVEELGSIETLKTDFFSDVSHEIKTPIAVIQNTAELLKNTNIAHEKQQEYIATIINSSKKLSALITNILKLNKLEKQNIQPVVEEYDLCSQLCECVLQFENQLEEKNIEFEADIEDRAMIQADKSLLELVWTNLLSNAIKFTSEGGAVYVNQYSTEKEVIISIKDTGCGMSKDEVKHIFDKFYQGDSSRSIEGNGLGLALAFRIVQMLDGQITVESEQGRGSEFTVTLLTNR